MPFFLGKVHYTKDRRKLYTLAFTEGYKREREGKKILLNNLSLENHYRNYM